MNHPQIITSAYDRYCKYQNEQGSLPVSSSANQAKISTRRLPVSKKIQGIHAFIVDATTVAKTQESYISVFWPDASTLDPQIRRHFLLLCVDKPYDVSTDIWGNSLPEQTAVPVEKINSSFVQLFDSFRKGTGLIQSEEIRKLALEAVKRRNEEGEDIETWARTLSDSVKDAKD